MKNKIKKIKYLRLPPEERYLIDLIDNSETDDLFDLEDPDDCWIDYDIWNTLYTKYNLTDEQIRILIKKILFPKFNISNKRTINPY